MASKKPGETWRGHVSQAVKTRYEAKAYNKVLLRIRQDGNDGVTADEIKEAAAVSGQSVNAWILTAIRQQIGSGEQQANSETTAGASVGFTSSELVRAVDAAAQAAGMTPAEWVEDVVRRELFG